MSHILSCQQQVLGRYRIWYKIHRILSCDIAHFFYLLRLPTTGVCDIFVILHMISHMISYVCWNNIYNITHDTMIWHLYVILHTMSLTILYVFWHNVYDIATIQWYNTDCDTPYEISLCLWYSYVYHIICTSKSKRRYWNGLGRLGVGIRSKIHSISQL